MWNFSKALVLSWLVAMPAAAEKISLASFCEAMAGQWRGYSAISDQKKPKKARVDGMCSADRRQLYMTVIPGGSSAASETWWFRQHGKDVLLTYHNGNDDPSTRIFTLYRKPQGFSLLGEGKVHNRPALIQLRFDKRRKGWQWLQQVQFLDSDTDGFVFVRGIDMQPKPSGN